MKTQKNIIISFVTLLIQFTIGWIIGYFNIAIPYKVGITLLGILGIISIIYALIALIKREAASGVGIIFLEFLFLLWASMGK